MTTQEMYDYLERLKKQRESATPEDQIELNIAIGELEAAIMANETEDFRNETLNP